jgi:hypothetical protein
MLTGAIFKVFLGCAAIVIPSVLIATLIVFLLGDNLIVVMALPVFVIVVDAVALIWFLRTARTIVSPVRSSAAAVSAVQIRAQITDCFQNLTSDQGNPFELSDIKDGVAIQWSGSLLANQLVDVDYESLNVRVELHFIEPEKTVRMRVVQKAVSAEAGVSGINASGKYSSGFAVSYSSTSTPSFEIVDGKPTIKVKELEFSTMEIQEPAAYIILSNGWNIDMALW